MDILNQVIESLQNITFMLSLVDFHTRMDKNGKYIKLAPYLWITQVRKYLSLPVLHRCIKDCSKQAQAGTLCP